MAQRTIDPTGGRVEAVHRMAVSTPALIGIVGNPVTRESSIRIVCLRATNIQNAVVRVTSIRIAGICPSSIRIAGIRAPRIRMVAIRMLGIRVVGIGGVMYDRPHLAKAQQLLTRAKAVSSR